MATNSLNQFQFTGYVVISGALKQSKKANRKWLEFTIAVKSKYNQKPNFVPIVMFRDIEKNYILARLGHLISINGEVITKDIFDSRNERELSKITFIATELMFIKHSTKVVSSYEQQYKAISKATSVDDYKPRKVFKRKSPNFNAIKAKENK